MVRLLVEMDIGLVQMRMKSNIKPIEGALSKVLNLEGKNLHF